MSTRLKIWLFPTLLYAFFLSGAVPGRPEAVTGTDTPGLDRTSRPPALVKTKRGTDKGLKGLKPWPVPGFSDC